MLGQEVQHEGAEAAHRALLDRDQHFVLAGQAPDQVLVERLGEAGVGDGGREAPGGQHVGGLAGFAAGACRSDRMATVVPSRTMRPLPISSGVAASAISTPTPSPRG